jgi:hypothetical protein
MRLVTAASRDRRSSTVTATRGGLCITGGTSREPALSVDSQNANFCSGVLTVKVAIDGICHERRRNYGVRGNSQNANPCEVWINRRGPGRR